MTDPSAFPRDATSGDTDPREQTLIRRVWLLGLGSLLVTLVVAAPLMILHGFGIGRSALFWAGVLLGVVVGVAGAFATAFAWDELTIYRKRQGERWR